MASMDWLAGLTIVGGYGGVLATYLLNERAKRREARRRVRIDFLTAAFCRLEAASNREPTAATAAGMEEAVRDVMLFGNEDQIRLARELIDTFAATRSADTQPLLNTLRSDLRQELLALRISAGDDGIRTRGRFDATEHRSGPTNAVTRLNALVEVPPAPSACPRQ